MSREPVFRPDLGGDTGTNSFQDHCSKAPCRYHLFYKVSGSRTVLRESETWKMNFGLWLFSLLLVLQKTRANLIDEAVINDAIKEVYVAHGHTMGRSLVDPPASNMKPVKWNEALAKGAQAYANTCPQKKGPNNNRHSSAESRKNIAGFASVGENYDVQGVTMDRAKAEHLTEDVHAVTSNAKHAMREWWVEHKQYNFDTNKCSGMTCGHYTQLVWADTTDIGCGMAMCGDIIDGWHGWFTLCRYGPAGNVNFARPYEAGEKSEKPVDPDAALFEEDPNEEFITPGKEPTTDTKDKEKEKEPTPKAVPEVKETAPPPVTEPKDEGKEPAQEPDPETEEKELPEPEEPTVPEVEEKEPAESKEEDLPPPPAEGEDSDEACCFWAKMGYCDTNPFWMRPNCQKSCGTPACKVDNAHVCAVTVNLEGCPWKDAPVPDDVPTPQKPKRPVGSPKPGCDNTHKHCSFWASMGECIENEDWMGPNCSAACGCGEPLRA